ncbi:EamA family transporter [Ectothiorhodospira shaposhnikovii]|uniref:DMT family transporter n=1 Tax=Ectothiorhodospira shaposhnikovii TaxID=1054 RepID=UPI00190676B0|nr:DMT family transporter [Ectothiorhodospira shaposhnikovii]MBK1671909.1 EamA family transporter [Ectothiorhodospira shaposhnikovii]
MDTSKGIWLRLIATGLFACMALCVKKASTDAPVGQIVFWRSSIALLPIILYLMWLKAFPIALKTKNWKGHLERSLYGCMAMFLSFISLAYLPLSLAAALGFLAPLMAIPMAAIILGERPSRYLVSMVFFGFFGVLVILYPSFESPELTKATLLGCLAGLAMALTNAFTKVKIKQLTQTEHAGSIAFYFALTCSLLGLMTSGFGWAPLNTEMFIWLIGAGLFGGTAHVVMTEAIARAPVSTLAVFEYTAVLWALGLDYSFFGGLPDPIAMIGVIIIIFSGFRVLKTKSER